MTCNFVTAGGGGVSCAGSGSSSVNIGIDLGAIANVDIASGCTLQLAGIISGVRSSTMTVPIRLPEHLPVWRRGQPSS